MAITVLDLIDELSYCAHAIETEAPEICRRPTDWLGYMDSYLALNETTARRLGSLPIEEAFKAARLVLPIRRIIAIDVLKAAQIRLHRQYKAEKMLP